MRLPQAAMAERQRTADSGWDELARSLHRICARGAGAVQPGHRCRRLRLLFRNGRNRSGSRNRFLRGIEAQTDQVLQDLAAILDAARASVTDLVKTTIFYSDVADFATLNEVYARHMPDHRSRRGLHQLMSAPARPTGVHRGHRRTPEKLTDYRRSRYRDRGRLPTGCASQSREEAGSPAPKRRTAASTVRLCPVEQVVRELAQREDKDQVKEKLERGDLFALGLIHLAPHACRVAIRVGRLSRSGGAAAAQEPWAAMW
jgi:hypothetical protein